LESWSTCYFPHSENLGETFKSIIKTIQNDVAKQFKEWQEKKNYKNIIKFAEKWTNSDFRVWSTFKVQAPLGFILDGDYVRLDWRYFIWIVQWINVDDHSSVMRALEWAGKEAAKNNDLSLLVATDWDDTVIAPDKNYAGCDLGTYKPETMYPGVLEFHQSMSGAQFKRDESIRISKEELQKVACCSYSGSVVPYKTVRHALLTARVPFGRGVTSKSVSAFYWPDGKKFLETNHGYNAGSKGWYELFTTTGKFDSDYKIDSETKPPSDSFPWVVLYGDGVYQTLNELSQEVCRPKTKEYTKQMIRLGFRKYINMFQYIHSHPWYDIVFLGDDGQGDQIAAGLMEFAAMGKSCNEEIDKITSYSAL